MSADTENMFKELIAVAKSATESQNSLQQEQLAAYQKHLQNPPEETFKFEGYFTARQLEKLGFFLRGDYFNGRNTN